MRNLFSRKQRDTKKEPKLSRQETKRIKIVERVKELDEGFNISSEHINSSFDEGLFVDEKNKVIGIYNAEKVVRYGKGKEDKQVTNEKFIVIPFMDLEMVSIMFHENKPAHIDSYHSESILIMSEYEHNIFIKDRDLQETLTELEKVAVSIDVAVAVSVSVSIHFVKRYEPPENKYDSVKWDELFNYDRDIKKLKHFITLFFVNMLSVEPLYIEKEIIKEENIKSSKIDGRVKYLEKNSVQINDNYYLIAHLINSWESIIDEISEVTDYQYAFYSMVLKAVRNNHIYLTSNPEDMIQLEKPVMKKVLNYVFNQKGYDQVSIVPSDVVIEKVPLEKNQLICEQIFKEVVDRWGEDFPKLTDSEIRSVNANYIYINYEGNEMEDLVQEVRNNKQLFEVIYLLTGYKNIEVLFVNTKDSIDQVGLGDLDQLWDAVQLFIKNNQLDKYSSIDLSRIKIRGYDNNHIFIYFLKENTGYRYTYLSFDEAKVIEYALLIYTGKKLKVEIIEYPEEVVE